MSTADKATPTCAEVVNTDSSGAGTRCSSGAKLKLYNADNEEIFSGELTLIVKAVNEGDALCKVVEAAEYERSVMGGRSREMTAALNTLSALRAKESK